MKEISRYDIENQTIFRRISENTEYKKDCKVHFILNIDMEKVENEINDFLKDKKYVDIKLMEIALGFCVMIVYK